MVTYALEPVSYDVEPWKAILHVPEPQPRIRKWTLSCFQSHAVAFLCPVVRWVSKELRILTILQFKPINHLFKCLVFFYLQTNQQSCFEKFFPPQTKLNKIGNKVALKIIVINFIVNGKLSIDVTFSTLNPKNHFWNLPFNFLFTRYFNIIWSKVATLIHLNLILLFLSVSRLWKTV